MVIVTFQKKQRFDQKDIPLRSYEHLNVFDDLDQSEEWHATKSMVFKERKTAIPYYMILM